MDCKIQTFNTMHIALQVLSLNLQDTFVANIILTYQKQQQFPRYE